jgi:hypothetical protein
MNIFQDLYDSEINFKLSWFWDGGIDITLGDITNGFIEETTCDNMEEVEKTLISWVIKHYPESDFALKYK